MSTASDVLVRTAREDDGEALGRIYNPYVLDSVATFEEDALCADVMAERVREVQRLSLPWLVAERDGHVLGYSYATRWKTRASYRYTTETTVYLLPTECGHGYGYLLYSALLEALQRGGIHVAIGGIALPNAASVALHERLGFAKIGQFREVGFKLGRWVDVGYWEKIF